MPQKKCTTPACEGAALVKSSIESSLSIERWECPRCRRPYSCPTLLTSGAQVMAAASACSIVATFCLHVFTMDWDSAIEHVAENLEQLLS